MANSFASLLVSLGLNTAEFDNGLTKAERQAQRSAQNIRRQIEGIEASFVKVGVAIGAGIGAAFSAQAFVGMVRGAIDAQEELSNVGKRAGITGSELSSLNEAAKLTHTGLEDVASMSAKLSKALLDFGKEGAQSTVVLKALGLSAKDVPALLAAPAEAVLKLAKLIDSLPEGGTKAAAQLLILGKAGGTTSAFLGQLATQTGLLKTRTDEEIEAAKAFNDRLTLMGIKSDDLRTKFANALLPTLDAVLTSFSNLTSAGGGVSTAMERLKSEGDIQEWARNGAIAIGTLAEGLVLTARLVMALSGSFRVVGADVDRKLAASNAPSQKPFGALGFSAEEAAKGEADFVAAKERQRKVTEQADKAYAALWNENGVFITDAIKKSFDMQDRAVQAGVDALANSDRNDRLNTVNNAAAADAAKKAAAAKAAAVQAALNAANRGGGGGDDPARKILEGQIRALEASIAREREILSARQSFLQDYYQDGRLSLEQYYDQLQSARNVNLQNALGALNQEVALAEAAKARATRLTDKEGFQNIANTAREKQTTLTQQAQFAEEALTRERDRATEQYGFQLNEINAKMLELAGNTAEAAKIRFTDQNAVFNRGLETPGATPAMTKARSQNNDLLAAIELQAKLNDRNREFQLILNGVGIAQERIALAAQTGAIGEFEALTKTSAAATAQIAKLTAIADAMEVIANKAATLNADGSLNIVKAEQLQRVEELRLGIEKLQAQSDLLAKKFNDIGRDAFSSSLQTLINGTGTIGERLKKAALDFGNTISSSITKAVSDNLAQMAFGKGGPLSGFGDIFSKLFGGKGATDAAAGATGAAGTAALTAAQTALTTTTSATSVAQTALSTTTAATTLAMTAVATAAGAAASALAALTISSSASAASSAAGMLFKAGSAFQGPAFGTAANGSDFTRAGPYWVGERGPEMVHMPLGARVTPNHRLREVAGGTSVTNVTFNVPPGANTASFRQDAKRALSSGARSSRRG